MTADGYSLSSLKLWRSQNQSRDRGHVRWTRFVVQFSLSNFWIVQLITDRVVRLLRDVASEQHIFERGQSLLCTLGVRRKLCRINRNASNFSRSQAQCEIHASQQCRRVHPGVG